jgi:hypothetical protein
MRYRGDKIMGHTYKDDRDQKRTGGMDFEQGGGMRKSWQDQRHLKARKRADTELPDFDVPSTDDRSKKHGLRR